MPQDYLLTHIEKFGRALAQLLGILAGARKGQLHEEIAAARQALKNELAIDIDQLTSVSPEVLLVLLQKDERLTEENLHRLGDILFILAENATGPAEQEKLKTATLTIYQHLDNTSSTWSLERQQKMQQLKK
jgi:predicted nuclease of restriction endonuclease-like RecB superfamily